MVYFNKFLCILLCFILFISLFTYSFCATDYLNPSDYSITVDYDDFTNAKYHVLLYYLYRSNGRDNISFYCYYGDSPIRFISDNGQFSATSSSDYYSFGSATTVYNNIYVIKPSSFSLNSANSVHHGMLLETYNYVSSISYLYFDANFKVLFDDNVIYPPVKYPYIENTKEDLESGKFSGVTINRGDLTTWDRLLLHVAKVEKPIKEDESIVYYANECVIDLTLDYSVDDSHYVVPKEKLNISFSNDVEYIFVLSSSASSLGALSSDDIYDQISFVVSGLTGNEQLEGKQDLTNQKIDETNKKLDEQTDAIKDQTETNKNIFERLGELLNFLNPFSKDFFVYKLIELLGDLIKSLFVPSDDFLSNWFTEVSDYFEDAFGILYYPIDLVIQVLGRFDNISGQEPVISFGNFSLFGAVLIPSYTYNFNDILSNDTLKTIHDFYLITIDVILWLGLLVYCKNVIANIFGGKFTDDVIDEIQDPGGTEKSYNNYSRYQENKRRYKQEHGGNRK